jgi:hypothetical protein
LRAGGWLAVETHGLCFVAAAVVVATVVWWRRPGSRFAEALGL